MRVAVALLCLAVYAATPLDLRTQLAVAAATFAIAFLVGRRKTELQRLGLVAFSVAATTRYLWWRFSTTIADQWSVDALLAAILLAAELYSCAMLVLAYVQSIAPLSRKPAPLPADVSAWPSVDVFIPTYDEPLDVVRVTVLAARAIDWPLDKLRVHLLDDGGRESFRAFAAEAGVGYLVRRDNRHAKAGNLNHALARTDGEFVAVFDCDHVPARSFLQVTMGWLVRDPRLALVQTPHHFYSPDPYSRNLRTSPSVPAESELFYGVIQPGLDMWNASFFCGSCAVLRRSALAEVGGIATDTVTEDAHTALRLHRRGWRTAYLRIPQAAGLETETLAAHVGQRIRWARGMAQIFRRDNPLLGRGLTLAQRLCYSGAILHFFSGIPRLIFLVAPVAYLVFGRHVFNALPLTALAYGLPHLVHSTACNVRLHGRFRHSFWSEVYEASLAWYTAIPTTIALLAPGRGRFNVTAKGGRIAASRFDARIAAPAIVLALVNLAAIASGAWRLRLGAADADSLAINVAWALHNLVVLFAAIAVACERPQLRAVHRTPVRLAAMLRLADGKTIRGYTVDLGREGASVALAVKAQVVRRERVWLSIFAFGEERALPAIIVARADKSLRVHFGDLALDEEAHLVRAIFSRADAWLGWDAQHHPDRPMRTLATIARVGFSGTCRALSLLLRPETRRLRLATQLRSEA